MTWKDDQEWERRWHGNCVNSYGEETKQFHYAERMGLVKLQDSQGPYFNAQNKTILDMGGGAYSILLKCRNLGHGVVVDPCDYPNWTTERYKSAGIEIVKSTGEDFTSSEIFDECWMYNVLQHTIDPQKIVENIKRVSKVIRVFDWLEIGVAPGHPQNLHEKEMNEWFGGEGKVEQGNGGLEYFGVFKGNHYEEEK